MSLRKKRGLTSDRRALHSFRISPRLDDGCVEISAEGDQSVTVCCKIPLSSLEPVIKGIPISEEAAVRFVESQLPQLGRIIVTKYRQQPTSFVADPARPGIVQGSLTAADIEQGGATFSTHFAEG